MKRLCFVLSLAFVLSGCTRTARFYPVQGPLSAQTPTPVLLGKVNGFESGTISVTTSEGEVCKGHWAIVPRAEVPKGASAAALPANPMAPIWDSVYGPGYYVAHVLGARQYARATVKGSRGTTMDVEIYEADTHFETASLDAVKGVAKDNKDNIYKLAF
ncbi:MAG TPA: hypothetical protein VGF06_18055 [Terriglobales bacterium]|jgi:hypothetical protein